MKKVFLGGTCYSTTWRDKLISMLKIDYFNPVVEDWTEDCRLEEIKQRQICDYCLYVVTPNMEGFYSIAEMIDDSNKRKDKCLVCFLMIGENGRFFTKKQNNSIIAIKKLIIANGGKVFETLEEVAEFLNSNS